MGRVADFDADVKRITRTLEALGEDSLRATPRKQKLSRKQLMWLRDHVPCFAELHDRAIAVGREPKMVQK